MFVKEWTKFDWDLDLSNFKMIYIYVSDRLLNKSQ